jgi:hypothetical protein
MAAGLVALAAVGLVGCTPHSDPEATTSAPATARTTSTPSPTPTGLPAGALLRISGVAVADDGTQVRIVETVLGPTTGDGSEDSAMVAADCSGDGYSWQTEFPGAPQWLHLDMTATLLSGSAWPDDGEHEIFLTGGNGMDSVAWAGSWHHAQAPCASGYAVIPGHATGVSPVVGDAAARTSWQTGRFGFGWDPTFGDGDQTTARVVMQDCRVELSSIAQSVPALGTRAAGDPATGQPCEFGTRLS